MAKKNEQLRMEGKVLEALPNETFKVELPNGHVIEAYVSGRMRRYFIRILPGDIVQIELSPYDISRGRIVYRGKSIPREENKTEANGGNGG